MGGLKIFTMSLLFKNQNKPGCRNWDTWEFMDADEVAVVVYPRKEGKWITWNGFVIAIKGDDWGMFGRWGYACGLKQSIVHLNGDWNYDDGANEFIIWPRLRSLIPEWFHEEFSTAKKVHVLAGGTVVFNRFIPDCFEIKPARREFYNPHPADAFESRFKELYRDRNRPPASEIMAMFNEMVSTLPPGRDVFKWGLGSLAKTFRDRDWAYLDYVISQAWQRMERLKFSLESSDYAVAAPEIRGLDAMREHLQIWRGIYERIEGERCRLWDLNRKFSKRRKDKPNFFSMVDAVGKLGKIQKEYI